MINGFVALPLLQTSTVSTTASPKSTENTVVFTHNVNAFDPSLISVGSILNVSKPSSNSILKSPIVKLHRVIPLVKPLNNTRQMRVHVFRPLFVYRQEQAMKKHSMNSRPPFDPDRFYIGNNYPYNPYTNYYHQNHHLYTNGYPDIYESYPFKDYDYVPNDLSANRYPIYDLWYP